MTIKNIALLAGGFTGEYEVSLNSAKNIAANLDENKYKVYTILVNNLSTNYLIATDTAIARYNNLNLSIRFQRVTSGTPTITINGYFNNNTTVEGSSGPPTNGVPYNSIQLNTYMLFRRYRAISRNCN